MSTIFSNENQCPIFNLIENDKLMKKDSDGNFLYTAENDRTAMDCYNILEDLSFEQRKAIADLMVICMERYY